VSLKQWADNGWLRAHRSSRQGVADLLSIVDRDLDDATKTTISADWRFGIAYNAALKLCTIVLHVSGWRPEKALQHYRTIQALPLVLGASRKVDADYLRRAGRSGTPSSTRSPARRPPPMPRNWWRSRRGCAPT